MMLVAATLGFLRWPSMKSLRLAPFASLVLLLPAAGCHQGATAPRVSVSKPEASSGGQVASSSGTANEPLSLAAALREQDQVEARSLSTKVGIRLEDRPSGATPEWFAAAVTTPGRSAGVGSARTLVDAVNQAVTKAGRQVEARGGRPQSMKIERIAYARLATGVYSAWAAMGDGSNMGEVVTVAAESPIQVTSPQVPMPSLRDPKAAIATGEGATPASTTALSPAPATEATAPAPVVEAAPAPAPPSAPALVPAPAPSSASDAAAPSPAIDAPAAATPAPATPGAGLDTLVASEPPLKAPSWWNVAPVQQGDRVVVGVMVEGRTTAECIAAAQRVGRTKLAAAIGAEPGRVIALRTLSSGGQNNMLRMFAIMSCKGTLAPAAEPAPAAAPADGAK